MATAVAAGFADPVFDSQSIFRTILNALARPGGVRPLTTALAPPPPLTPELAAIALALADHEAQLWLDAPLASSPDVVEYLRFHTGAPIVADPAAASFALVADPLHLPPFAHFAQGTDDYPDRSTTVVVAVTQIADDGPFRLEGPGIKGEARFDIAGLPHDAIARLEANHALFPRGVDLIFVATGRIVGVPRSSNPKRVA